MSVTLVVPAHANPARARTQSSTLASSSAWFGALLLVALAPFEALGPVLRLPWQSVSNLELAIVVAGAAWAVSLWIEGGRGWWRTPLTAPWAVLLTAMFVSASFAPAWHTNAFHLTGRVAVAAAICLMTANGATSPLRIRRLLEISVAVSTLVALLAILEFLAVGPVLAFLRLFRPYVSVVGEQVRATGTLQYPTIASMYLEINFAFALGLMAAACEDGKRASVAGWTGALLVIGEGIVLTFTRAGVITMAIGLALVAAFWFKRRGVASRAVVATVVAAAALAVEVVVSHPPGATRLRLTSEAQDAWYRAEIGAPRALALKADETITVPLSLTNVGRVAWSSDVDPPFRISYHWVMPDDDRVVAYEGLRTLFPQPVAPGESVTLPVRVRAPEQPGRYRLLWDVAEEGRLWFTTEPGATMVFSSANVGGPAAAFVAAGPMRLLPRPAGRPGRFVLWRAAARMFAAHPLLGIGPDNFRLSYGAYAGLAAADPRVHTNNMYLEIAVGAGLAGALAFAWLLWVTVGEIRLLLRSAADPERAAVVGIVAASVAIAVHGCVDSFVGFTPIYVLIGVTLGLAVAAVPRPAGDSNADRV